MACVAEEGHFRACLHQGHRQSPCWRRGTKLRDGAHTSCRSRRSVRGRNRTPLRRLSHSPTHRRALSALRIVRGSAALAGPSSTPGRSLSAPCLVHHYRSGRDWQPFRFARCSHQHCLHRQVARWQRAEGVTCRQCGRHSYRQGVAFGRRRRHAILELIAQPPPQRCPLCRKWICNEQRRE